MIFAILTLVTALLLASVAGWFSIIGIMTIYAGGAIYALVMGVVLEIAKLVTVSWVYRNWEYAGWKLKVSLIYFVIALMAITSIGVFGFLSKLHLEQGAGTINNSARVERINDQISREQSAIAANDKIISQLDATLDSYIGNDRADRSVVIRRRQEPQRKQLKQEIVESQKRVDEYNTEKFTLESQIRSIELEVGPIRYISEIFYGKDYEGGVESAVRTFSLIIVSTLDPLAIILLIAANQSLLRLRNKKEVPDGEVVGNGNDSSVETLPIVEPVQAMAAARAADGLETMEDILFEAAEPKKKVDIEEENTALPKDGYSTENETPASLWQRHNLLGPRYFRYTSDLFPDSEVAIHEVEPTVPVPWMNDNTTLQEFLGGAQHFTPKPIKDDKSISSKSSVVSKKHPETFSWLAEFKGVQNE